MIVLNNTYCRHEISGVNNPSSMEMQYSSNNYDQPWQVNPNQTRNLPKIPYYLEFKRSDLQLQSKVVAKLSDTKSEDGSGIYMDMTGETAEEIDGNKVEGDYEELEKYQ